MYVTHSGFNSVNTMELLQLRKIRKRNLKNKSERIARQEIHAFKLDQMKRNLVQHKSKVLEEREKWQGKLNKLNEDLDVASDRLYREKSRGRKLIQDHIDKAEVNAAEMQNYIDDLEDHNETQSEELKAALKAKRDAVRSSRKTKALADQRLRKWHDERMKRRDLSDALAAQEAIAKETLAVVKQYEFMATNSEESRRRMQKEWDSEAAARQRGGSRRWPVWVVQLICELLVNGTPPASIPGNIQIMYETLFGEPTDDLPSVNFVRSCRTVVEVMGETITALKLAKAPNWKQLWTDATTRRQIPFTALIIGLLGDDDKIDPVVVSSCIFMENEKSETGAAGILTKVSKLDCPIPCYISFLT